MSMTNMEDFDYDYLVIGGGSGGIASAKRAASHGAKVAGKLIINKIVFFSHFTLNSFFLSSISLTISSNNMNHDSFFVHDIVLYNTPQ